MSGYRNYGSIMVNSSDSEDSDDDDSPPINHLTMNIDPILENINESYIAQIRDDANLPYYHGIPRSNIQVARIRRRPILRTRSEPDFALLDDAEAEEIRKRLIKRYGGKIFPIKSIFKFTRRQKIVLALIALIDFTSFCGMSILAPFFPNEAAKKLVPSSISGFVFSVYALVVFLTSPIMGKLVSHVGPKFLLVMGIFLGGATNILFGLLDKVEDKQTFIIYCFVVRTFEGIGAAAFSTASYTFVAKIFPDNIGSVLGLLETFVGLGLSVGPAIGGVLYDYGGFGLPFFTLGSLMLSTIPLCLCLLESENYDESIEEGGNSSMLHLLKSPPIIVICLVIVVASNSWGFLDPTLEPHLREFNLTAKQLGLFFLLSSLLYAISSPIWGLIADKIERTYIMMGVGLLFSGFGLLLLGPATFTGFKNTILTNVISLAILGVSISMTILPTFEGILDFALVRGYEDSTSTYGLISGVWSSMYSLGEVLGPSLGGYLLDNYGFPLCSTVMACLCLVLGVFVLLYFLIFHKNGPQQCEEDKNSTSNSDKKETSDSGISENVKYSSNNNSSSSSSLKSNSRNTSESIFPAVLESNKDERTPLLSRSLDRNDFSFYNSNIEMPKNREENDQDLSIMTPPSVLKNISVTNFGAVEC